MDKQSFKVGDRVRLRGTCMQGTIWDVILKENTVIVDWGNLDDEAQVVDPQRWLEKITG